MIKTGVTHLVLAAMALGLLVLPAPPRAEAASGPEIEARVDATLRRFFNEIGGARTLADKAVAMLVFPRVVKAGIGVGGEYGEGALRRRQQTLGYYSTVSASFGFQLGAQARSVILMFMTERALQRFRNTDGWKIGVDGSVAIVTIGAGGAVDTNSIRGPVIGFIFNNKGLMYNLTLEGSKISRINR